ncbi:MAG TPA: hypothetical protein V6D43_05325 [Candidatus Sericytochromatia bacterium]
MSTSQDTTSKVILLEARNNFFILAAGKSTPKEPVERQGYQGGYSLGLGSPKCSVAKLGVIHDMPVIP